jgi:hypothetical protein
MTHIVTGLTARQTRLAPLARAWRLSALIDLTPARELLPLREKDSNRLFQASTSSTIAPGFERLTKELI